MKDYCLYDYERRDYILKYEIDKKNNEIVIYYADDETYRIPYTVKGEIRLLKRMRKQVEDSYNFIEDAKQNRGILHIKRGMILTFSALSMAFLTYGVIGAIELGAASAFLVGPLTMNALIIAAAKRRLNQIGDKIDEINSSIIDYNKNVFYLSNENVFTDERILRRDVVSNSPKKIQELSKNRTNKEVPILNLNNLEELSMKDLKKTYEASLQSRGPELVLKPKNKR